VLKIPYSPRFNSAMAASSSSRRSSRLNGFVMGYSFPRGGADAPVIGLGFYFCPNTFFWGGMQTNVSDRLEVGRIVGIG
jgi:hypothetical protein